jgi:hypothetical protein
MRQVRTHTSAPGTSPKLKSLQDLSIKVNPEVTKEVMHYAGLRVNGGLHLHLYMCKVIHPLLESSDPLEFSTTDGPENGGKLFIKTNPLK